MTTDGTDPTTRPDPPAHGPAGPSEPEGPPEERPHIYGTADGAGTGDGDTPGTARRWWQHPWRLAALAFIVAAVAVVAGGILWVRAEADPSGPVGPQVIVSVPAGTGVNHLAASLESKGVIGSSFAYRIWSQVHSIPGVLSGSYAFNRHSSFAAVDAVIAAGPNVFPLSVPPGFTVAEVAERVGQLPGHDRARFAALAASGTVHSPWQPVGSTNLDGLLGTGRYVVVPGETDTQLLTAMVDRFDAHADALGLAAGSAALGLTPYQAITVASIVEKEGVIAKNLGPVARVVLNRLHSDTPLQMDSTVLYAEGRDGGTVTTRDLQLVTPYNTYLNRGLTPTPICFPSVAALQATLHPPPGSWLFFVVVEPDGTEAFADTFAQQQANEALARRRGLP